MASGWYRYRKNFSLTLAVTIILDIVIAKGLPNNIAKSSRGISEKFFHKAPLEKEKEVVYTEDMLMNDGLPVAKNVAETVRFDNGLTLNEDYLLFPGLKGVLPASFPREGRRPGSRTSGNRTVEYKQVLGQLIVSSVILMVKKCVYRLAACNHLVFWLNFVCVYAQ